MATPALPHRPSSSGAVRVLALAAAALLLAPASEAAAAVLDRDTPVVVHAEGEPDPLTSVQAFAGRVPGVHRARRARALRPARGSVAAVLDALRARGPGPRRAPHRPPRGRLGAGPVPPQPRPDRRGRLLATRGRRTLRGGVHAVPGRPPGRVPRPRLPLRVLRARRARPHVAASQRRRERGRPRRPPRRRPHRRRPARLDPLARPLGGDARGLVPRRAGLPARPGVLAAGAWPTRRPGRRPRARARPRSATGWASATCRRR